MGQQNTTKATAVPPPWLFWISADAVSASISTTPLKLVYFTRFKSYQAFRWFCTDIHHVDHEPILSHKVLLFKKTTL